MRCGMFVNGVVVLGGLSLVLVGALVEGTGEQRPSVFGPLDAAQVRGGQVCYMDLLPNHLCPDLGGMMACSSYDDCHLVGDDWECFKPWGLYWSREYYADNCRVEPIGWTLCGGFYALCSQKEKCDDYCERDDNFHYWCQPDFTVPIQEGNVVFERGPDGQECISYGC